MRTVCLALIVCAVARQPDTGLCVKLIADVVRIG